MGTLAVLCAKGLFRNDETIIEKLILKKYLRVVLHFFYFKRTYVIAERPTFQTKNTRSMPRVYVIFQQGIEMASKQKFFSRSLHEKLENFSSQLGDKVALIDVCV